ncbi:type VII secretion target [Gordonia zhaorongruii]|uniref:type VII secretion target n=1 Tax=Gordonia zhaorongruii TaxID=2597659 RepID=UPI00140495E4|nr:type VII secretion target [Gordonia zhaorongruii]
MTVEPAGVAAAAAAQGSAAALAAEQAVAERLDIGALGPTFGIIGAQFLAALAAAGSRRARALDALAAAHGDTSAAATTACTSYTCCDEAGAAAVSV